MLSRKDLSGLPIPLRPILSRLAALRGLELTEIPPNGTERTLYQSIYPGLEIRVIFDVGANVGNVAQKFSSSFPEAEIYCFEPASATYRYLCEATAQKANITCFRYGVGDSSGMAYITKEENSELNRVINNQSAHESAEERIQMVSVDDFCETHSIKKLDIIKTDTEGYDLRVLRGAERMIRTGVSFVLTEVGMTQSEWRHTFFHDVNEFLSRLSFRLCGFYETHYRADGTVRYANALFVRERE